MSSVLYTKQLKEPTSMRWQLLKLMFLLVNLICMVGSVVMAVLVVAMKSDPQSQPPPSESEPFNSLEIASDLLKVIPLVISFIINTVGFIGVTQLNIRCIQIYTGFLVFNLLCSLIMVHPIAIVINLAFLTLIVFLIDDINKANFW